MAWRFMMAQNASVRLPVDGVLGVVEIEETLYAGGQEMPRARWVQRR
jgi:hypothetical protein